MTIASIATPKITNTPQLVEALKNAGEDFNFYPTTDEQLDIIIKDIKTLNEVFEIQSRRDVIKLLDIGSGDGHALQYLSEHIKSVTSQSVDMFGIEKATIHINSYVGKGITLLGTEFAETNFISKPCDIGFCNPPYDNFIMWMVTLINQLNFKALYMIVPNRWKESEAVQEAINRRGIKYQTVLGKSDFLDARRKARAKVDLIRFSFNEPKDITEDDEKYARLTNRGYKPQMSAGDSSTFQMFIENELGLKKSYSKTTEKFSEYEEKARIEKELNDNSTPGFALVKSEGILAALIFNYEAEMDRILDQYKAISSIEPALLQELGVDYDALRKGIKEKLFNLRSVYWSYLFDKLDTLKEKLIGKYKKQLLSTLNSTSLDFTHKNAVYVVSYAVDLANNWIEKSLIDVFQDLTSESAIKRYYKSNTHVFKDDWRHNKEVFLKNGKYMLDYRFIVSGWSNFSNYSWERGLSEGPRELASNLFVVFNLLGYSNLYFSKGFNEVCPGDKLAIIGFNPEGERITLVEIKFYKNGNRHMRFDADAQLRFNATVSRLLGWVRSKEEFADETDVKVKNDVWEQSDKLKVLPSTVLVLTAKAA